MSAYGAPYETDGPQRSDLLKPVVVRQNVIASQSFYDSTNKDQVYEIVNHIIAFHWGDISQFLLGQRMIVGIVNVVNATTQYPDLRMEYQRNNGNETLTLTVFPDTTSQNPALSTVEFNYDGYIAWVHSQPNYPDIINNIPNIVGPYDIFLNGYAIETGFQPAAPCGGYVILLGDTALRCESLQDKPKKNAVLNSQGIVPAGPVLPPPGWGKYPDGVSPAGQSQPAIDKMLGYWIFDWSNVANPCQYIKLSPLPQSWAQLTNNQFPVFTKGMQFKDATKSPLTNAAKKGIQNFGVLLSPMSNASEVETVDVCMAEFYDRSKMRAVKQSWKYNLQGTAGTVSINDSPLIFGFGFLAGGFSGSAGLLFDLTDKAVASDTNALLGPHDADQSFADGGEGSGLTDAQATVYNNWSDAVRAAYADYIASIQPQLDALANQLHTAFNDTVRAYKLAIIYRALVSDPMAFEKYFPDFDSLYKGVTMGAPAKDPTTPLVTKVVSTFTRNPDGTGFTTVSTTYGPVQIYYIDLSLPFSFYQAHVQGGIAVEPLYVVASESEDDPAPGDNPATTTFNTSYKEADYDFNPPPPAVPNPDDFIGPDTITNLIAQIDNIVPPIMINYASLQKQYADLVNATPPASPPRPPIGDSIQQFSHRTVTIGGDWFFGAYS